VAGGSEQGGAEPDADLLAELTVPAEPLAGSESLSGSLGERYQVLARLGSGAFGEVYRAHDHVLGREVAIKRIRLDAYADREQLLEVERRLVREAQVAARLRHPGIVTTHDIVSSAGSSFIVMEYVAGRTLEDLLEEKRRLGVDEVVELLGQVAAALDHAHASGVVHRDVKPANVMVEPSGHVKVMDFGIAKVDSGSNLTATGAIMGTPNYMSPEQARGEPVDARSDLFSLGCVLHECLTGLRPFQAESVAGILVKVVTEDPPAVDLAAIGLAPELGAVLARAVAKNPAARFASGAEMIAAVRAAAARTGAAPDARPDARGAAPATVMAGDPPTLAPVTVRWKLWAGALAAVLALGLLAWIATDPHSGPTPVLDGALVAQEPRGVLDRLLRREPRVRVTIPEGTWLRLALETPVSSETAVEGQPVSAVTTSTVRVGGLEAVPKGSRVTGRVKRVASAARADGRGELSLAFESLALGDGQVEMRTTLLTMRAPAPRREKDSRRSKVIGAVSGLIDRIKGSGTEGGSAGAVSEASAAGREIALREGAALSVELAAAVTVRRAKPGPGAGD
jgi:serine/threonine-protein kinase